MSGTLPPNAVPEFLLLLPSSRRQFLQRSGSRSLPPGPCLQFPGSSSWQSCFQHSSCLPSIPFLQSRNGCSSSFLSPDSFTFRQFPCPQVPAYSSLSRHSPDSLAFPQFLSAGASFSSSLAPGPCSFPQLLFQFPSTSCSSSSVPSVVPSCLPPVCCLLFPSFSHQNGHLPVPCSLLQVVFLQFTSTGCFCQFPASSALPPVSLPQFPVPAPVRYLWASCSWLPVLVASAPSDLLRSGALTGDEVSRKRMRARLLAKGCERPAYSSLSPVRGKVASSTSTLQLPAINSFPAVM